MNTHPININLLIQFCSSGTTAGFPRNKDNGKAIVGFIAGIMPHFLYNSAVHLKRKVICSAEWLGPVVSRR